MDLPDPRHQKSCDHLRLDLLAISVLAVACGADDWCDIAMFAKVKLDWLKTFLELPGGAPSHDTFGRVFGLLNRTQFAANVRQEVGTQGIAHCIWSPRGPARTA